MRLVFMLALLAAVCAVVLILFNGPARSETCTASHYGIGDGYGGRRTASGERMNPYAHTAAHRTASFGTNLWVVNLRNRQGISVRVTDRGPFIKGRCIDLSYGAARAIGCGGLCRVTVER
jgi:rare lipoprotein A